MSDLESNTIHTGDCFDVLGELPSESIHACVSDPPYGLAFMGRDWDDFEPKEYQEWCEEWATAARRVLKPGGHLLAFSGNRTHHRLFTGVEDAGFEIRDTLTYHYGCLSEDTEVLTPDGWKEHDEIEAGDSVMAFDPDSEQFNIEETNRVFRYDHDGTMVRYQSPHTDQLVTPNHRVLHRENAEWKTTYATRSYGNMELPIIHASGKVRLPGDKDLSDMLLGVGSTNVERGGGEGDLLTGVCKRAPVVETTRCFKGARKQTAGGTGWGSESGVCEMRHGAVGTTGSRGRKQLLFSRVLSAVAQRGLGYVRPPSGDSTQGRNVRRSAATPLGANEWREQSRLEGGVTEKKRKGNYKQEKLVRCPDEFEEMARSNGYVPVHRLKVAREIGRPLTSEEVVHHKDHDNHNNDLENLELWPNNRLHKLAEGNREEYLSERLWPEPPE